MQHDINGRGSSSSKRSPVPMVVLRTQQEIHEQNCGSSASDDHEPVGNEEEPEHVVDLGEPDRGHDEVELDEDGGEWQQANKQCGWDWLQIG